MSRASSPQPGELIPKREDDEESSTPESRLPNRRPIWSVKSQLCEPNSPNTKSYRMSAQALIGLDRGCGEFFDTRWTGHYSSLWLPTETVSHVWLTDSSSSSLLKQEANSWFMAREGRSLSLQTRSLERTSFPSFTFSPAATTGAVSTPPPEASPAEMAWVEEGEGESASREPRSEKNKSKRLETSGQLLRCRRIKIAPTPRQAEWLRHVQGIHRHIYNECVDMDSRNEIDGTKKKEESRVRALLTGKVDNGGDKEWKNIAPCHPKQQAVAEFFRNKRSALANLIAGHNNGFTMHRKSRFKSRQESLPLEKYKFNDNRVYSSRNKKGKGEASISILPGLNKEQRGEWGLGREEKLRIKGPVPREFRGRRDEAFLREEIKILRTRLGDYYAVVSFVVKQTSRFEDEFGTACSFDPGNRVFLSWYSEDGTCGDIGRSFAPLEEMLGKADDMQARLAREKNENNPHKASWRRRRKRIFLRLLQRVRRRIDDLHNKVASWCVNRFRLILLPKFETSIMGPRSPVQGQQRPRVFGSRSCRSMLTWSHYRFQQRLLDLAQRYTDVKAFLANEAHTTIQCGECGTINHIGGSAVFECSHCGIRAPRDMYSAMRILQRATPHIINA